MNKPEKRKNLNGVLEESKGKINSLLDCCEDEKIDEVRTLLLRWIDSLKDDCVVFFTIQQMGYYKRLLHRLNRAESNYESSQESKRLLGRTAKKLEEKIVSLSQLALQNTPESIKEQKEEFKKWVPDMPPEKLMHFVEHIVGVGMSFSSCIENQIRKLDE